MSANQLVKVPFHGDELDAMQDGDGKVWAAVKRCSENLGLAYQVQQRKLKNKEWATTTEMVLVAEDGKERAMSMIDLDSLPMWLASIDPRKVKPAIREKIVRYQKECARVLANHFFGRAQAEPQNAVPNTVQLIVQALAQVLPPMFAQIQQLQQVRKGTVHETNNELKKPVTKGAYCGGAPSRPPAHDLAVAGPRSSRPETGDPTWVVSEWRAGSRLLG